MSHRIRMRRRRQRQKLAKLLAISRRAEAILWVRGLIGAIEAAEAEAR